MRLSTKQSFWLKFKWILCNNCSSLLGKAPYLFFQEVCLITLRERCPYVEFFWSVFSRIRTKYQNLGRFLIWAWNLKLKYSVLFCIENLIKNFWITLQTDIRFTYIPDVNFKQNFGTYHNNKVLQEKLLAYARR